MIKEAGFSGNMDEGRLAETIFNYYLLVQKAFL